MDVHVRHRLEDVDVGPSVLRTTREMRPIRTSDEKQEKYLQRVRTTSFNICPTITLAE